MFLTTGNTPLLLLSTRKIWNRHLVTIGLSCSRVSANYISCKLLVNEHILCSDIIKNLSTNNLLSPFQHGFKKFQSWESYDYQYPRSCFCLKWQAPIRCGALGFFQGFWFCLSSPGVIYQVGALWYQEQTIVLVQKSFNCQSQKTVIVVGGELSQSAVTAGVPQGSMIGTSLISAICQQLARWSDF